MDTTYTEWMIYNPEICKKGKVDVKKLNDVPPWIAEKQCASLGSKEPGVENDSRGKNFLLNLNNNNDKVALVRINMALYLRKPMLVRGDPGVGKSSLAYSLAYCLGLGKVIRWPITSHSTIREGLYRYDAIDDLSQALDRDRKPRFYLGPLGQAVAHSASVPAVLLLDEIDKSDMDLPNDLLHFLEDPSFRIEELAGQPKEIIDKCQIIGADKIDYIKPDETGRIQCVHFPIIVMTSNEERPLSQAFLRRCITVKFEKPDASKLEKIAQKWFPEHKSEVAKAVEEFIKKTEPAGHGKEMSLSTDACLLGIYHFLQTGRLEDLEELYKSLDTNCSFD